MNLLRIILPTYLVRLRGSSRTLHEVDLSREGFRIDTSDNVASNSRGGAPSRPPSRTSYPDEPMDLTAANRPGTGTTM